MSLAYGAGKALGKEGLGKVCAVLGDSTFLHAGIPAVADTVYNKGYATTIICDNRTTGMTGLQEHPGTGFTIKGEPANMIDYEQLVRALGVKHVRKVDPYSVKETTGGPEGRDGAGTRRPSSSPKTGRACSTEGRSGSSSTPSTRSTLKVCRGCKACLELGCPAISWTEESGTTKDGKKRKGDRSINRLQCPGCGLCSQVCKFEAILPGKA